MKKAMLAVEVLLAVLPVAAAHPAADGAKPTDKRPPFLSKFSFVTLLSCS